MLLAFDIGNSQIVCGVFCEGTLLSHWRLSTDQSKTPDEYNIILRSLLQHSNVKPEDISGCIVSSVVPPLTNIFDLLSQSLLGHPPLVVTSASPHGLTLRYNNPEEIGTDRLVNAAAAFARYQRDLIIVDFGTATTFCTITKHGEYLGGAIAPGLKNAADTLHLKTAKLPKVDLAVPKSVIGLDTTSSMQAGIMYGYSGLVDEIVRRIQQETGKSLLVIATGGLAPTIVPISHTIQEIRPHLTLEGLHLLHTRMNFSCG
jgi:type III pantothenate kinase